MSLNMETDVIYKILISCSLLFVLKSTWEFLNWAYIKPRKWEKILRKQGLNGNSYRFIRGDLQDMMKAYTDALSKTINIEDDFKPRTISFIIKTIEKYGKNSFFWRGVVPSVIITDAAMIKEVMNKYNMFIKPTMPNPLIKFFVPGLVTLEKEKWAKHRKIINPAFHLEKLKLMIQAFCWSCDDVLDEWEKRVSREESFEIDVCPCLESITSDAISRTLFGISYEKGRRIFELQKEQAQYVLKILQSIYIPGYRFLPTKRNKRMKEIEGEIRPMIRALINNRIDSIKAGEDIKADLLSIMLESSFQEIQENGNQSSYGLSIDDIIEECKVFYFAGQETVSTLISWSLVLLGRHTEWQARAREEVLSVFGDQKPNADGLNQLKILTMILLEVLRLYPATNPIIRRATEDTKLGNLLLPAGIDLVMPTVILHHDREIWGDDAMEFNPQRFSEGVAKAQKSSHNSFFPFGWGPRLCIGHNFAMMEAKVVLSMILQRVSFGLSPSYKHAPQSILTMQPQYGVHLILSKP